ncbi:MAG TPA: HDOD domain-containing protein [Candidatus Acidoferrales bacterium]
MTITQSHEQAELAGQLSKVPAFPVVAIKVLQIISNDRGQLRELSDLITSDAAISGEILRMANSALFGIRMEVSSILQATHMLGLERVKGLVVTIAMKAYLNGALEIPALRACWRHSLACALISEDFAKVSRMEGDVAYTAGLMHDVGRLALVAAYRKPYADFLASAEDTPCDALQRERELFGVDHCQVGQLLMTRWKLPKVLMEVASRHHDPAVPGEPAFLSIVRRSCRMADTLGFGAIQPHQSRSYVEILAEIPERERTRFPPQFNEFVEHIASRINSLECA